MKFLFDYVIGDDGTELPVERQLELAQTEFRGADDVTITLVQLDANPVKRSGDCPFAMRSLAASAVVVETNSIDALCQFSSDTGRLISVFEASEWESADDGATLLRYRLFASRRGYCGELE